MATVTGYTAEKMQELSNENVVGGSVVGGNLILTKRDLSTLNAGSVIGPAGATGPQGPAGAGTTTICTSTTRPSSPTAGQQIYETDKQRFWMWTGSTWKWISGNPPMVRLRNVGVSQVIPNNTFTPVAFGAGKTVYDIDALCHDEITNNSRITIPAGWGGLWHFGASTMWFLNATGNRALTITRNGTPYTDRLVQSDQVHVDYGGIGGSLSVTGEAILSAGDYIEMTVFQSSGAGLEVHGTANHPPTFWASFRA